MSDVDYADVQGLVRFGYGHMTRASYALVKVKNVAAAKSWLRSAPVTSAVAIKPPPATALNVAFTPAPTVCAAGCEVIEGTDCAVARVYRPNVSASAVIRIRIGMKVLGRGMPDQSEPA